MEIETDLVIMALAIGMDIILAYIAFFHWRKHMKYKGRTSYYKTDAKHWKFRAEEWQELADETVEAALKYKRERDELRKLMGYEEE